MKLHVIDKLYKSVTHNINRHIDWKACSEFMAEAWLIMGFLARKQTTSCK